MKIVNTLALGLFLASAEAFGPAQPVLGTAFGASSSITSAGGMTMRIGTADMRRRIKFNNIIKTVGAIDSKEGVEKVLLSDDTASLVEKSNWKLRKYYLRKIRMEASKFDVKVDGSFGAPPTQEERMETEKAAGAARSAEKEAHFKSLAEQAATAKAARVQKKAEKRARLEAAAANKPAKKEEPKAEAPAPAAPAPAAEAAPAAAAAPAAGGGEITPTTIKKLRDATGAGMMDCKKALLESDGDQEAAAEYLRKKGLAQADKKAARVAAEGKIAVKSDGKKAVLVEVNCETDFVGKDSSFLEYCERVAGAAINVDDDNVESLMAQEVDGESLESTRQALVSKIGENIQVRRLASRGGEGSTVGAYVHMNRIGVLVELEGGDEELCTDVAMHVAAMNPPYATPDDVPGDVVENEKRILSEQALESGKPAEIVEKMVEGRIRKYLEEICLVSQPYVRDSGMTVQKLLESKGAKMIGFSRIAVGEGIEKKEDDFAAEVAKMAGGKV